MFMSYAKASARFGKTPGIAPGARFTLPKSPTSVLPLNPLTATLGVTSTTVGVVLSP